MWTKAATSSTESENPKLWEQETEKKWYTGGGGGSLSSRLSSGLWCEHFYILRYCAVSFSDVSTGEDKQKKSDRQHCKRYGHKYGVSK